MQRFAYFTGMSDKPTVVTDSVLDGMRGHELFRTVHDDYDRNTDIGYTSTDIIKQISRGDYTMYSDSGGSAYGKAIYFASSPNSSSGYVNGHNDAMMRAKITGGKGISKSSADNMYRAALARGDKLARACSKADSKSASNLYALSKGYDYLSTSDYYMILNRRCLTVSDRIKKNVTYGTRTW